MRHLVMLLLILIASVCSANDFSRSFRVELKGQATGSNLIEVRRPIIEGCDNYRITEHHRQTSMNDPLVSYTEFKFSRCQPENLNFSYTYRLIKQLPKNKFCSYSIVLYESELLNGPQARVSGDCNLNAQTTGDHLSGYRIVIS